MNHSTKILLLSKRCAHENFLMRRVSLVTKIVSHHHQVVGDLNTVYCFIL